jgi:hypothetical protein
MKQINQIGKYTRKQEIIDAKRGRTFITPQNRSYVFDYNKVGAKYIFIINYLDKRWQITESDFNKTNIDDLLKSIELSNKIS